MMRLYASWQALKNDKMITKVTLPDGFFEIDENWKNSVNRCEFELADSYYEERKQLLTSMENTSFLVSEEDYYYQVSAGWFYERNEIDKAYRIINRVIEKGYTDDRNLKLIEEIKEKLNKSA